MLEGTARKKKKYYMHIGKHEHSCMSEYSLAPGSRLIMYRLR
jgi:hypothetical protein